MPVGLLERLGLITAHDDERGRGPHRCHASFRTFTWRLRGLSKLSKPPDLKSIAWARNWREDPLQRGAFKRLENWSRKPFRAITVRRGFESLPLRFHPEGPAKPRRSRRPPQMGLPPPLTGQSARRLARCPVTRRSHADRTSEGEGCVDPAELPWPA